MSDCKLVIFDFDGTLGDTRANIIVTMQQALERLGYPVAGDSEVAATIGLPLEESFACLVPGLDETRMATCAATYREIFEMNRRNLAPGTFPHVLETLEALKDMGFTLSVASSRNSVSLNSFLKDMGLAPFVPYVLGADNVTRAKPDPEPVLKTLAELGFKASDTMVVGDMPVDVLMGKRAGARTCAVTYGNASRQELEDAGADYIIDDIASLLEVLK